MEQARVSVWPDTNRKTRVLYALCTLVSPRLLEVVEVTLLQRLVLVLVQQQEVSLAVAVAAAAEEVEVEVEVAAVDRCQKTL